MFQFLVHFKDKLKKCKCIFYVYDHKKMQMLTLGVLCKSVRSFMPNMFCVPFFYLLIHTISKKKYTLLFSSHGTQVRKKCLFSMFMTIKKDSNAHFRCVLQSPICFASFFSFFYTYIHTFLRKIMFYFLVHLEDELKKNTYLFSMFITIKKDASAHFRKVHLGCNFCFRDLLFSLIFVCCNNNSLTSFLLNSSSFSLLQHLNKKKSLRKKLIIFKFSKI